MLVCLRSTVELERALEAGALDGCRGQLLQRQAQNLRNASLGLPAGPKEHPDRLMDFFDGRNVAEEIGSLVEGVQGTLAPSFCWFLWFLFRGLVLVSRHDFRYSDKRRRSLHDDVY